MTAAFRLYLRRYNHGRPFGLIGHSQGSFVLEQMIHNVIDRNRRLRARMLSAILLGGGNVLVKDGSDVGGTFQHVPACRTINDLGCVIAFSSFDQPVPSNSLFGRTTTPRRARAVRQPGRAAGPAAGRRSDPAIGSVRPPGR